MFLKYGRDKGFGKLNFINQIVKLIYISILFVFDIGNIWFIAYNLRFNSSLVVRLVLGILLFFEFRK